MYFSELLDYCQSEAIANKLSATDESIWRQYCRKYSMLFSTPLDQVLKLEPMDVMLNVFEHQLEDVDIEDNLEKLMEMISSLQDPEYAKQKRDEFRQFIKESEKEEELRQKEGRPIHKALLDEEKMSTKKRLLENTPLPNKKLPHSGGINLSYLEKEETGEES